MRRSIAIEVRRSHLHLAVLEEDSQTQTRRVRSRSIPWQVNAKSLATEEGLREMSSALSRLAAEEELAGAPINLALSGEFCVARIAVGAPEVVRREIREIEERIPLYMSLGRGKKLVATTVRQIDARNQHATVAVTNQDVPQVLMEAAENARLHVEYVEPSLVAMSRVLGHGKLDAQAPVIVVNVGQRSSEIGISLGGRLLLEYRSAGRLRSDEVADVVARHRQRLQKFVERYHRLASGPLEQVYLSGRTEPVTTAYQAFQKHAQLKVAVLEPAQIGVVWEPEAGGARGRARAPGDASEAFRSSEACVALGTCLFVLQSPQERHGTNLMESIRATRRQPMSLLMRQTLWPAAAVLLIALFTLGGAWWRHLQSLGIARELASLVSERDRVQQLQTWIATSEVTKRHLLEIQAKIAERSRVELLSTIAQCMPPQVWLDRIDVDSVGKVTVHGSGYSEDEIYDFIRWLSAAPGLKEVQLEGTTTSQQTAAGPLKFDVKFDLANSTDSADSPHPVENSNASFSARLSERTIASQDRYNRNFVPGPDRTLDGSR